MNCGSGLKGLQFGLAFLFTSFNSFAGGGLLGCPVTLAWNASPDANVSGYALYYGLENPAVTNRLDVGPAQSVMLTNLYANSNYFFFVVAYNASSVESLPTGPLLYSPPAITKLRINKLPDGSAVLQFRTAADSQCSVEYASSLNANQWQTLAVTNADAWGNVSINDPPAGSTTSRFYRAVRP